MPKTEYKSKIDGFAFVNNWDLQPKDYDQIKSVIDAVIMEQCFFPAAPIAPIVLAASAALSAPANLAATLAFGPLAGIAAPAAGSVALAEILKAMVKEIAVKNYKNYGLCGGMALAALDYYVRNWLPPRGQFNDEFDASRCWGEAPKGRTPTWDDPAGKTIRGYIWQRLLDSLKSDGFTCLLWMAHFHGLIPGIDGPKWLLDRSKEEWAKLKTFIDRATPCPIGHVGTTKNPGDNHQILVTGYDDNGNGTGAIYAYDSNFPNSEQKITLDFRGSELRATQSGYLSGAAGTLGYHDVQGPIKGFYCVHYAPQIPPVAVGLSAQLRSSSLQPVSNREMRRVGTTEEFRFTAHNNGWGNTPPLKLYVAGRTENGFNVDPGGEAAAVSLSSNQNREVVVRQQLTGAAGWRNYFTSSSVEQFGQQSWRLIPAFPSSNPGQIKLQVIP